MSIVRKIAAAAALSVIAWISVGLVVAQGVHIDSGPFFRTGGWHAIRFWQDFELRREEVARDVLVVAGSTTIAGTVDGDVVAVLGPVRLESTASIRGSLVVVAGDVTVVEGAAVRRDLMVFGGSSTLPATFLPGGEYVAIGNAWIGAQVRALVPWLTYGLLWGRLIVFSIGWVWWFVAVALTVTLAINLMLHGPVGRAADTLAARPASAFITGLLMLLLTGPAAVILAATLIGLAIVPFFLCAVVVAWVVGKVSISRWIGRTILGYGPDETRTQAMLAVLVGFAAICLLYAVPLVGLVTWALVGVLGLGTATLTVLGALRRERARTRPAPTAPTAASGGPGGFSSEAVVIPPVPAQPASGTVPLTAFTPVAPAEAQAEPAPAPQPAWPAATAGAPALALMARATFLDRLVAGVLDVLFVALVFNLFLDRHVADDVEAQLFLLLAYVITFWAWKGTTLGGIVCNLRVLRLNGTPIAGADAIVRGLASLFSFIPFGLGFFWILRDPERQAWHDRISGTMVVKVPKDYPI